MSCCGPPAPPPVLEPYDFLTSCDRGALGHALSFYSEDAVHRREPGTNCTALHFAAGQGHTHIVAFLLDRGADINAMGRDGRTALAIAAGAGHLSCVALLLRRGADPAVSEGVGCLPVFAAARGDQLAALKMVMDAAQPAPTLRDESGHSLLGWAAYRGNLTAVRMLHEMFKVPCDTVDGSGRSPLHWAAREGYTEVAIYLMANGLNPLARDQENVTPLQYAIDRHHPETAAALAARRVTPLETAVGTVKAIAQERWYAMYAAANVALFVLGYFSLHFLTPMLCLLPFISAYPMRRLYMHRERKTGVQGSKPEPTLAEVVDIPNKTADMLHGPAFLRRRDPSHLIMWPLLFAAQLYVAHTLGAPISSGYVSLLLAILVVGGVACKWRALADVVPRGTLQEYPLWAALAEGNYRDAVQLDRVLSSEFLVRVPLRAFRCEQLGALVRRYEGWSHWWDCAVSAANKRWWMLSLLAALFLEVHVLGAGWSLLAAQCPATSPPRSAVLRTFLSLIAQGEPCPAARSVLGGTPVLEHSLVELIAPRNAGGAVLILIPCALIFCCLHGLGQFLLHAARGISAIEGANATAPATCGGLTSIWRGKGGAQEPVFSEGSATLNLLAMLRGVDGARWATVQALPPAPGSAADENATAGFATKLALSNQAQSKAAKGGHHGHSH